MAFERGTPRRAPPLRIKPPDIPSRDDGEEESHRSINVALDSKTVSKFTPHTFTTVEDFLAFQKQHAYVMSQQDVKANWKKILVLFKAACVSRDALSANTVNPAEKKARKKFEDQAAVLKKRVEVIMTKAFTIYQQMCGPALRTEWDQLVQDHCFTTS